MALTADRVAYELEIVNFLKSVTIKFSPFVRSLNELVLSKGFIVDEDDPLTWKYYVNAVGDYHPSDTVMTIQSVDTQQQITFNKQNLITHPRTASVYKPGRPEYEELCNRYPDQVDLIKNIIYPCPSAEDLYNAEDLTLIRYGSDFLEDNEIDSVIFEINKFLEYHGSRWYNTFLDYEPYFYLTYWGTLWYLLIQCIHTTRLKNIQTSSAHSYHIWEYLKSNGIDDYRDVLSKRQSLFLYRNINYLRENAGKQSNLRVLVDNLLTEINVGLVGKFVYQKTGDGGLNIRNTPEIVSVRVPTRYSDILPDVATETVAQITTRLFESGYENNISEEHILGQEDKLGSTIINTMPTKVLEIRPITMDKQYADLLNVFLIDSLVYDINREYYQPYVIVSDPLTGSEMRMTAKDALVLYYYCIQKSSRRTPTILPTRYKYSTIPNPNAAESLIPKTIIHNGHTHITRNLIDNNRFLKDVSYPPGVFRYQEDYVPILEKHFHSLINQLSMFGETASYITILALEKAYDAIMINKALPLQLSPITTYENWLSNPGHNFQSIIDMYDDSLDKETKYQILADTLMGALLPADLSQLFIRVGNLIDTKKLFKRLKELFIQLCSYTVVFLERDADIEGYRYVRYGKLVYDIDQPAYTTTVNLDITPKPTISPNVTIDVENKLPTCNYKVTHTSSVEIIYAYRPRYNIDISFNISESPIDVVPTVVPDGISTMFDITNDPSTHISVDEQT